MSLRSCSNCIHYWVCSLPASTETEEQCPTFLDMDKCKEVIYARWEFDEPDNCGNKKPRCSNCRQYFLTSWSDYAKCKICPECGALMWLGDFDV
jgi:hypothetical protein